MYHYRPPLIKLFQIPLLLSSHYIWTKHMESTTASRDPAGLTTAGVLLHVYALARADWPEPVLPARPWPGPPTTLRRRCWTMPRQGRRGKARRGQGQARQFDRCPLLEIVLLPGRERDFHTWHRAAFGWILLDFVRQSCLV